MQSSADHWMLPLIRFLAYEMKEKFNLTFFIKCVQMLFLMLDFFDCLLIKKIMNPFQIRDVQYYIAIYWSFQ